MLALGLQGNRDFGTGGLRAVGTEDSQDSVDWNQKIQLLALGKLALRIQKVRMLALEIQSGPAVAPVVGHLALRLQRI